MVPATESVRVVGRYALYGAIAAGGMATVHLGRLLGPVGFSRTVAIKRLHAQFAADPEFVSMFLDEARLAARIRHPNVVPTLDVVATGGELFLVMEYVPGESVSRLARALRDTQQTIPLRILSGIMAGVLHGLHAAHEAKDERGHPLGIVHRDVSPQNVLVGTDGVARVLDFGVAKAAGRVQTTREGQIKGKLSYMPPEQLRGAAVSRQTDIYACGVMLWELVTGQRLFVGDNEGVIVAKVLEGHVEPPSHVLAQSRRPMSEAAFRQIQALDQTILRALHMNPEARHATARELAIELERRAPPATASEIGDWVETAARDVLSSRAQMIAEIESSASLAGVDGRQVMSMLNAKPTPAQMLSAPVSSSASIAGAGHDPNGSMIVTRLEEPRSAPFVDGPPVTQPSSISVSTGTPAIDLGHGRRTALTAVIGIMLGVAVVGAGGFAYRHFVLHPSATQVSSTPETSEPNPSSTGATSAAPPAIEGREIPPPGPASAQDPTGAGSASANASPSANTNATGGPTSSSAATGPSAPASAGAAKPSSTKPPHPTAAKPQPPPPKPPPTPPADDCSTPYWYDAAGVKHYKEQCLKGPK